MDSLVDSIADFVRARQLNIAVVGILTLAYLAYQYWDVLFKQADCVCDADSRHTIRQSRSRSRSCSRSKSRSGYHNYKLDDKHGRRGRKTTRRRCSDCSLCNYDQ